MIGVSQRKLSGHGSSARRPWPCPRASRSATSQVGLAKATSFESFPPFKLDQSSPHLKAQFASRRHVAPEKGRPSGPQELTYRKWPWVKIQIAPPVNIPFSKTGVNSPTNQNGINHNGFDHHSQIRAHGTFGRVTDGHGCGRGWAPGRPTTAEQAPISSAQQIPARPRLAPRQRLRGRTTSGASFPGCPQIPC